MLPRTILSILIIILSILAISTQTPGVTPTRLIIPAIDLDSPIVPVAWKEFTIDGRRYGQWLVDDTRVGWHCMSARLGQVGNTVLNGHGLSHGAIFKNLHKLRLGDTITVAGEAYQKEYTIVSIVSVREDGATLEERTRNARLIEPTNDERITLITCWPKGWRLIIVAK